MWTALVEILKIVWHTVDRAIHTRRTAPFIRFMILACSVAAAFYMLRGV
jgi:hypothetical protein